MDFLVGQQVGNGYTAHDKGVGVVGIQVFLQIGADDVFQFVAFGIDGERFKAGNCVGGNGFCLFFHQHIGGDVDFAVLLVAVHIGIFGGNHRHFHRIDGILDFKIQIAQGDVFFGGGAQILQLHGDFFDGVFVDAAGEGGVPAHIGGLVVDFAVEGAHHAHLPGVDAGEGTDENQQQHGNQRNGAEQQGFSCFGGAYGGFRGGGFHSLLLQNGWQTV